MRKDSDNFFNKLWFGFKRSWYKHPILWNIFAILLSLFLLSQATLWFLDVWTHHGQTTIVPNVVGMDYQRAVRTLQDANLEVIISDSVYRKDKAPGSVMDVIPQPNSTVKAGREVYVTIVAFSPEPITIDAALTDMSYKMAESILKSKGLRVEKRYVPYQFDNVVVDVKCNGKSIGLGSRVTANDVIVLEVGQVPKPVIAEPDPLDVAIDAAIDADGYDDADAQDTEVGNEKTQSEFGLRKKNNDAE